MQATDTSSPPSSVTTVLNIRVKNVNDAAPIFPRGPHRARVFENEKFGRAIYTADAKDHDKGIFGQVTYSFHVQGLHGDRLSQSSGPFSIDAKSGEIIVSDPLDYEERNVYELVVRATDSPGIGGDTPKWSHLILNVTVQVRKKERRRQRGRDGETIWRRRSQKRRRNKGKKKVGEWAGECWLGGEREGEIV